MRTVELRTNPLPRFAGMRTGALIQGRDPIRSAGKGQAAANTRMGAAARQLSNQCNLDDEERDVFQPDFLGKRSTIPVTILCRLGLQFRQARKARPYVLLEWYARVDSNHRPCAPEAFLVAAWHRSVHPRMFVSSH